ncbi:type II secretion system protein, partial [Pyxidicoccus sp. 3LG]
TRAPPWPGDPGSGAYFMLSATGEVTPPDYAIPPGTPCDSTQLRAGTYCREVLVTRGLPADVPANVGALLPAGARPVTVWTRVMRVGAGAEDAVLHNEVFVQ